MILLQMQISGFLSYQEKVLVDFSEFDLACISGANGAGKSSLLEAITWVLFGEARRRDDAVINHQSDTAEVILDFLYENENYQVQRAKKRDKSTLLEFRIRAEDGAWKALTEATVRGTEDLISTTLHLDYDTFINSAFFLQGKADQFAQQNPTNRKKILSSILGLDIWEVYKEEAARRRRLLEGNISVIDEQLASIEEELKLEDERKARLVTLEKTLSEKKTLADARKTLLDQQRLIADQVMNESAQLQKQAAEIDRLKMELAQSEDILQQRLQEKKHHQEVIQSEKAVREELAAWQAARLDLEKWDSIAAHFHQFETKRQTPLLKIEREGAKLRAEHDGLLTRAQEISTIVLTLETLRKQNTECQEQVRALNTKLETRADIENRMRELQDQKAHARAENLTLKAEMDEIKEKINRLQADTSAVCPTCEKPLDTAEKQRLLADLTARGTARGDAYRQNLKTTEECETAYKELETALVSLQRVDAELKLQQRLCDSTSSEITRNEGEIEKWNALGALRLRELELILSNEGFALDARAELAVIDSELKELGYDPAEHEKIRQSETEGRDSQVKLVQLEAAKAALAPLEREIADLEMRIDKDGKRLAQLKDEYIKAEELFRTKTANMPDMALLETEYYQAQEEVNRTSTELGYTRNQVEVLHRQREQKTLRTREKEEFTARIANLKELELAFGKDGIPALLIEQALPEIQEHANDILDHLSNGAMALSFETQKEFKDKKRAGRRETLDILVRDSAGERAYELFSGGEAFRINFAIRMALSQILTKRAGARLQTLVIDEGFGSQDADGLQRLIEAINLSRSDFAKILVISHLEEMKDAFSARIEVTKTSTGSRVQVVAG